VSCDYVVGLSPLCPVSMLWFCPAIPHDVLSLCHRSVPPCHRSVPSGHYVAGLSRRVTAPHADSHVQYEFAEDRDGTYSLQYTYDGSKLVVGHGDGAIEVNIGLDSILEFNAFRTPLPYGVV